ncbi:STAS-like domain-containing protein [Entomobacter blattae]|uniref:DUF4325 domain-containing protein n=1 Tax=Entomobacter blattae TaxID=2762277 RepID=A0A7H1NU37_9PROT|nr:DUF4325 domain-containing protein [Entomobacter blattae]QNT79297.1 hypothetical protein JGUZn3_20940 [Entomobacter blattae]
MTVLKVLDYTKHCHTSDDGDKILHAVLPYLQRGQDVCLDFQGVVSGVPSSFVNGAFVSLLDHGITYDVIKKHLKLVNSHSQLNRLAKERVQKAAGILEFEKA